MTHFGTAAKSNGVCGVRSIHFGVADFDGTLDFFSRGWGLSIAGQDSTAAYLRGTGEAKYIVALHKREKTEVLRVDLRVPDRAAVDGLHAHLKARGSETLTAPADVAEFGGGYGFRVRDPDGRLLQVLAGDEQHADTTDGIDLPRKISHVVMNTPQVDVLESFYIEGLGARIVDRTRRIHFINVNNDHHSIALVPSKIRSLHHIAFEMPSFDALMRGVGRLRERGTNIGWGVGRHGPGNNIFAYYVGPENIPLEYTTEVAQVDETYRVGTPDDWKPIPGRMDQWGATPPPSPDMVKAEQSVEFSSGLL